MTPGNDKRGLDFTDLMMWLAIASKHVRLMVLLVCFSLLCGLDYFIYARPLYFSKALVSFKEIPGTIDTQSLNRSERPRMTILSELQAPTLQSRVEAKLGNVPNRFGVKKELIRRVQADFVSEDSIELGISTYSPQWASTFPETLVQEFLNGREERRLQYREEVFKKTTSELAKINEHIQEDFQKRNAFKTSNDFTTIQVQLEQMRDVPQKLLFTKQRIADMDNLKIKLQDRDLSLLSRLALLSSLEYDLKVGQAIQGYESLEGGRSSSTNSSGRTRQFVVPPALLPQQQEAWKELERKTFELQQQINEGSKSTKAANSISRATRR